MRTQRFKISVLMASMLLLNGVVPGSNPGCDRSRVHGAAAVVDYGSHSDSQPLSGGVECEHATLQVSPCGSVFIPSDYAVVPSVLYSTTSAGAWIVPANARVAAADLFHPPRLI